MFLVTRLDLRITKLELLLTRIRQKYLLNSCNIDSENSLIRDNQNSQQTSTQSDTE